ncbi:DUF2141 domain-containing protein [Algivirga pacifica]|uniref:DUF2141 domain-containing protein n=1 Tax=Algivirga pacifica TaxID=1162670 RepID=A0ABP9D761_9BACT
MGSLLFKPYNGYAQTQTLEFEITNIEQGKGTVFIALYDRDGKDWIDKPFKDMVIDTKEDKKVISFEVPYGTYAISVFQDLNDNGELDDNMMGVPKEPIAFGNNYKPLGNPKFDAASVPFNKHYKRQQLKLYKIF